MAKQIPGTEHLAAELNSELLVKMIVSEIESEGLRFDTLDSKAGLLLGFGLVTVAELVGFLLLATSETRQPGFHMPWALQVAFYLGVLLLICGAAFAMYSLYPRGFIRDASIITLEMLEKRPQVYDVLMSVLKAKESNKAVLIIKGRWTRAAGVFVLAGLLCFAVLALLLFRLLVS